MINEQCVNGIRKVRIDSNVSSGKESKLIIIRSNKLIYRADVVINYFFFHSH